MIYSFTDESGQRGFSERSSDCFVLASVYYLASDEARAHRLLERLREDLGRRPQDPLKWSNLRSHTHRVHAARTIAGAGFLAASAVVVCKRAIPPAERLVDEDRAYLYTFRFLLERLSWMARARRTHLRHTLAHIVRFKSDKLRAYERRLLEGDTAIAWAWLRERARIGHPEQLQCLQLADLAASAIAAAFNRDGLGYTEPRYLEELLPALRRGRERRPLASYGLKMHPWNDAARRLYPWVELLGSRPPAPAIAG